MIDNSTLSPTTRRLHWLLAVAIMLLTALGFYMATTESWQLYPIHKSLGVSVFLIATFRVIWRMKEGWPAPAGRASRAQLRLARLTHWILLMATLAMPVSGMIASGASGHGFGIFALTLLEPNPDPSNADAVVPYSQAWADFGYTAHTALGYLLIAVLVLHLAAALKHHRVDRDRTLLRMLGR